MDLPTPTQPGDLDQVFEAILDGIVVVDRRGRIKRMNGAARRILGIANSTGGMVEGGAIDALRGTELFSRELRRTLEEGISCVVHDLTLSGEGSGESESVIDVETAPLTRQDGSIEGAAVVLRDGTIGATLRQAREARLQDQVFGRMAAGIAHEVKNPLGGIRGAAELLARNSDDKRSLRRAELIISEVDRIAKLIDDFMSFTNDRVRPAPINIHRILDDVLAVLEMDPLSEGLRFERRFDPSIPELLADGDRLHQIFLNLGRNGLDAMREGGGTLRVTTRLRLDHRVELEGGIRVPGVVIDVEDEGCGLPEHAREQVGTPFFTTKQGGTGLGLALSRHFVSRHGGSIQLRPRDPTGTRVRVVLPLRRPA
jgi:two-component system nitrogen regulation sensor histidine kinase GlnL